MPQHEVERFKLRTRWLHWVVVGSALILAITGMFLYMPPISVVAQGGYTRVIHRIAAVLFVGAPVLYFLMDPAISLSFLKRVFTWRRSDLEWAKAAPGYFFCSNKTRMPPQPGMDSGQKMFALVTVSCFIGFVATGTIMWIYGDSVSDGVFNSSAFAHELFFVIGGTMVLVHMFRAVHPRMPESLSSMITGKVSADYAKSHHGKWYAEVTDGDADEETPSVDGQG